jgi:hypothetical protein
MKPHESKQHDNKKPTVAELAGRLATAARYLVGGHDLNGFCIPPANIETLAGRAEALKRALDDYDEAVLAEHCKQQDIVRK